MKIILPPSRLTISFALLISGYCLINHYLIPDTLQAIDTRSWRQLFNHSILFSISFGLFILNITLLGGLPRAILAIGFSGSAITDVVYQRIAGSRLTFESSLWLLEETGQAGNIIKSYTTDIIIACAWIIAGILTIGIAVGLLAPTVQKLIRKRMSRFLAITGVVLLVFWNSLLFLGGFSGRQPSESIILTFAIAGLTIPEPKGRQVAATPTDVSQFEKVVLIVDESIRHDYFSAILEDEAIRLNAVNFGEAISASGCSAATNAMLRWGFSMDLASPASADPREHPKIWKYAKKAGYRTNLLDGQASNAPQNFIGKDERSDIDNFEPSSAGMYTDKNLSKRINAILRRSTREFIYVNKRGAHYAYEYNYPSAWDYNIKTRSQSYAAAIIYSTHGFFDAVVDGVDMRKVLIIYTSDHGQRLDGSAPSHCNRESRRGEYSVPLLAFTGNPYWHSELENASILYRNRTSHNQIFPTLLTAFGYERQMSGTQYFPTLLDSPVLHYIIEYPFAAFPTFRFPRLPVRAVAEISDVGPDDSDNDPPANRRSGLTEASDGRDN